MQSITQSCIKVGALAPNSGMPTELEKMLAGELYDPLDAELAAARRRARDLCQALNNSRDEEETLRARILKELFGSAGESPWIQPPFYCDFGTNITLGDKVFFNFNCVVLDVASVRIGSYTMFGPNAQIYTAMHPVDAAERRRGLEFAKPITIGADVWVGGSAVICPGVTIGSRSIIGAGSVVTRDIPDDVFAAGNPCKVIRSITNDELAAQQRQRRG
jgi:maltose O-acetyltransferase